MNGFLDILLEGASNPEDIQVDEKIEKEIEESCLPMTTLIEATFSDVETGINAAIETYEMACIVGGVKVVAENMDQDGATELLTEASDNLFTRIWEQIKKACDWVVSMIQKLIINVQAIGKDIKAGYAKIESDFDKNFKAGAKYKGYMFDLKTAEEVVSAVDAVGKATILKEGLSAGDFANTEKGGPEKDIVASFIKESGIESKAETIKDVVGDVKKALGISGDASEITIDSGKVSEMKAVVTACTKDAYKKEKQAINSARKTANQCKSVLKKAAKEAGTAKEKVSAMSHEFSAWTHLMATICNLKLKLQYSAGRSYLSWMKKIAKGKGTNGDGNDNSSDANQAGNDESSQDASAMDGFIPGYSVFESFEYGEVADLLEGSDESDDDDELQVEESFNQDFDYDGSIIGLAEQLLM